MDVRRNTTYKRVSYDKWYVCSHAIEMVQSGRVAGLMKFWKTLLLAVLCPARAGRFRRFMRYKVQRVAKDFCYL
jgi:hypothetical protein